MATIFLVLRRLFLTDFKGRSGTINAIYSADYAALLHKLRQKIWDSRRRKLIRTVHLTGVMQVAIYNCGFENFY